MAVAARRLPSARAEPSRGTTCSENGSKSFGRDCTASNRSIKALFSGEIY